MKTYIKQLLKDTKMFFEYMNDYLNYRKYNYGRFQNKTYAALQARMLRLTHVLEKGMSLSKPRKGYGIYKIDELMNLLDDYTKKNYQVSNVTYLNAISVLKEYMELQQSMGFQYKKLDTFLDKLINTNPIEIKGGVKEVNKETLLKENALDFKTFFEGRFSIRQFSQERVKRADIEKAVQLAMKSPSECNRQSPKVYFFEDSKKNEELGKIVGGNRGSESEISNYLIITSNTECYYDAFERNQMYVDGGIFSFGLILSLKYYGIGSCMLQNGELIRKNRKIRRLTGIPENERIIMFISIGYYKEKFLVAISNRKDISEVLVVK